MRRLVFALSILAVSQAVSFGAACAGDTLANYATGGFSCVINSSSGDLTFSNFAFDPPIFFGVGTGLQVSAAQIQVNPFGFGSGDVGFIFTSTLVQPNGVSSFFATGTQLEIYTVRYNVATALPIVGATQAALTAADTCSALLPTQCGSSSLTKDIFAPAPAPSSGGSTYATANVNSAQGTSSQVSFAPVTSFGVRDSLSLQANNNSTTVMSFRNDFFVPEPATLSLAGLAFVGFALIGRRNRR